MEALRIRTRRRLIGAFVLVAVAVLTLPVLLDSQPRRLDLDVRPDAPAPAGLPRGADLAQDADALPTAASGVPTAVLGATALGGAAAGMAVAQGPTPGASAAGTPQASAPAVRARPSDAVARVPAPRPAASTPPAPAAPVVRPAPASPARAQAAAKPPERSVKPDGKSDGKPDRAEKAPVRSAEKPADRPADKPAGKVWLQVGAYSEAATVRSVRQRIDKAGLHSVEQPVTTSAGPRTRVRLGPFASKDEADKALARLRAAGLAATAVTP